MPRVRSMILFLLCLKKKTSNKIYTIIIGSSDKNESHAIAGSLELYISKRLDADISASGYDSHSLSTLTKNPLNTTSRMATVDAIPTSPKLSASPILLAFLIAEIPAAKARTKGTVIAPVVAPEASKEI